MIAQLGLAALWLAAALAALQLLAGAVDPELQEVLNRKRKANPMVYEVL